MSSSVRAVLQPRPAHNVQKIRLRFMQGFQSKRTLKKSLMQILKGTRRCQVFLVLLLIIVRAVSAAFAWSDDGHYAGSAASTLRYFLDNKAKYLQMARRARDELEKTTDSKKREELTRKYRGWERQAREADILIAKLRTTVDLNKP